VEQGAAARRNTLDLDLRDMIDERENKAAAAALAAARRVSNPADPRP